MNTQDDTRASELLKHIEEHCGEKLQCSSRMRMQITMHMQRIMDEKERFKANVSAILNGSSAYDSKSFTLRRISK